jgi:hypothetical protein
MPAVVAARSSSNGSPATAAASARLRVVAESASSSPMIAAEIGSGTPSLPRVVLGPSLSALIRESWSR